MFHGVSDCIRIVSGLKISVTYRFFFTNFLLFFLGSSLGIATENHFWQFSGCGYIKYMNIWIKIITLSIISYKNKNCLSSMLCLKSTNLTLKKFIYIFWRLSRASTTYRTASLTSGLIFLQSTNTWRCWCFSPVAMLLSKQNKLQTNDHHLDLFPW